MDDEGIRTLLKIEWDNFRYQDQLRWSRMQTIGIIEAAILTGAYGTPLKIALSVKLVFVCLLSTITVAICSLAEKDGLDATDHKRRAFLLEEQLGFPKFAPSPPVFGLSGHQTIRICIGAINVLNALVVVHLAWLAVLGGIYSFKNF